MRKPDKCVIIYTLLNAKKKKGNIICTPQRLKSIILLERAIFNYFKILGINEMHVFKIFSLS